MVGACDGISGAANVAVYGTAGATNSARTKVRSQDIELPPDDDACSATPSGYLCLMFVCGRSDPRAVARFRSKQTFLNRNQTKGPFQIGPAA